MVATSPIINTLSLSGSGRLQEQRSRVPSDDPSAQERGGLKRTVSILQPNDVVSNSITTSKYNAVTFCPLVLYELLHPAKRFANFYFLCVGCMQMIKAISLTQGVPSTWSVLVFLILVDAFFMAKEDLARHRADKVQNSAEVAVLARNDDRDAFEQRAWSELRVGDVVKVRNRESFPADLLLLRASDPTPGQAWVNTKPLDGESDTKLRLAPKVMLAVPVGIAVACSVRARDARSWRVARGALSVVAQQAARVHTVCAGAAAQLNRSRRCATNGRHCHRCWRTRRKATASTLRRCVAYWRARCGSRSRTTR